MNKNVLLALMVWAIDTDQLSMPFNKAWELFTRDALGVVSAYTNPEDELLYCPHLIGQDPIQLFADYVLVYAKMQVTSGIISYGKLDKQIVKYSKHARIY